MVLLQVHGSSEEGGNSVEKEESAGCILIIHYFRSKAQPQEEESGELRCSENEVLMRSDSEEHMDIITASLCKEADFCVDSSQQEARKSTLTTINDKVWMENV
ncbi:hypothetical protein WMY93_007065 [Mugilogobius chulae]|uniref:Uncharacterized protein n=1 Tax=Mugilogobius chulae TaxID=88201 RepID=A0AAW0PME5_9GOBI